MRIFGTRLLGTKLAIKAKGCKLLQMVVMKTRAGETVRC